MRSLERVNIRTNVRTYLLTYIWTGQTLYPLHNFVARGDNYGICSKGLKNEFETAVVNEPSVFEPLKFYCSLILQYCLHPKDEDRIASNLDHDQTAP